MIGVLFYLVFFNKTVRKHYDWWQRLTKIFSNEEEPHEHEEEKHHSPRESYYIAYKVCKNTNLEIFDTG